MDEYKVYDVNVSCELSKWVTVRAKSEEEAEAAVIDRCSELFEDDDIDFLTYEGCNILFTNESKSFDEDEHLVDIDLEEEE